MVALTRDFHVFAAGVPTRFAAKFLAIRYVTEARQVRAFLRLLIRHCVSSFFEVCLPIPMLSSSWRDSVWTTPGCFMELIRARHLSARTLFQQLHSDHQTRVVADDAVFQDFAGMSKTL